MNGLSHQIYHLDMPETHLALERRLDLMEEMYGVFLEFINLRKLSNSYFVNQKTHGMS